MMSYVARFAFCLFSVSFLWQLDVNADSRPNIIVFYTDDHGHADLSCQGVLDDIHTPHTDALAARGARIVHGYSTAPQCVPSRGGLLVGKFQGRFGLDSNGSSLAGFNQQTTIAERLQAAGYVTAQFGKWHLGPTSEITQHGFQFVFAQNAQRPFSANINLNGQDRPMGELQPEMYHVDGCSRAACSIIERFPDQPLFLYIAYRAPHVPLDAPPKYLSRFPGKMPERRRQALAMISAIDDGIGQITEILKKHQRLENTLIFYIGDNGAPLKIHKADIPGGGPGWDGSLNDPLNGEKGMLSEGGMHVPFVVSWPKRIPAGQVYKHPISALDVAATAAAVANIEVPEQELDGVNLIPFLSEENSAPPHEALYWRWTAQSAIRKGDWKLLRGGDREYLYNLAEDLEEKHNLADEQPEIAKRLRGQLLAWSRELAPPGLTVGAMSETWNNYFDFYLDGKPAPPLASKFQQDESNPDSYQNWLLRNGTLKEKHDCVEVTPLTDSDRDPFLTISGLKLQGPVKGSIYLNVSHQGQAALTWRVQGDKGFPPAQRFAVSSLALDKWEKRSFELPVEGTMIHVRLELPKGKSRLRLIELQGSDGQVVRLSAPSDVGFRDESSDQIQIYAGGVAGFKDLLTAKNSEQFREAGGGLYLHNNGWAALAAAEQQKVLELFDDHPIGIELGFGTGPAAEAWANRFKTGYGQLGIKPAFIAANAYMQNNRPTVAEWNAYSQALRESGGVPATTLIVPTFEYANFAPNIPVLKDTKVSQMPEFQQLIESAGGLALDVPCGYFFGREHGYREWVVDAILWAKERDLTVIHIASPHRSQENYDEDTTRLMNFLKQRDALPDIIVCENYEGKPAADYPNRIGEESVPHHVLGVARMLQKRFVKEPSLKN